jgi:hypothetical protein
MNLCRALSKGKGRDWVYTECPANGTNLRLFRNPPNFVLTTKIPPDLVCAARLHLLILKIIECYCLQVSK